ncbi:MAG: thermonuclease family protein [Alphaproteobacteria bacterium]|nr:thermonuclease family protein [Alphaproteobacteria bacterium]
MRKWVFLLVTLLSTAPAQANSIIGDAIIVDGDSIIVNEVPIRLWGIDAPETGTLEGDRAKAYMRALTRNNQVRCEDNGQRIQGHIMAQCFIGEVDLGSIMVLSGNAVDWRRYSGGYYTRQNAQN